MELLFFFMIFELEPKGMPAATIATAAGFAMFENACYLSENGAAQFFLEKFCVWVEGFSFFCLLEGEGLSSGSDNRLRERPSYQFIQEEWPFAQKRMRLYPRLRCCFSPPAGSAAGGHIFRSDTSCTTPAELQREL